MLPRSHVITSSTLSRQNIILTSSVYHQLTTTKQQQKTRRRPPTIAKISTVPTGLLFLLNSTNTTSLLSSSSSTSSTEQQQQILLDDSYSAKTGIKTAALLGGMLILVVVYLIWKARARLCRSSTNGLGHPRLSATKFDLDYWLKQVDILEAKEVERNRGGQSLYLELPTSAPRDNRDATASWITDAYRQWRLIQYRQQQQLLRQTTDPQSELNPVPYRRRRQNPLRRLTRRLFASPRSPPLFLLDNSSSLIADMRPSIVSNHFIPPALTSNSQLRRASSWPRLRSNHHQTGAPMSALQTHLARKRLLKRSSRTTFDI